MKPIATAIVTLLLLPTTAAAKSGIEVLGPTSQGLAAGQTWVVGIEGIRDDRRVDPRNSAAPAIVISKPGVAETHRFDGRRQPNGTYTARVVFPSRGTWTYRVTGFGPLGTGQRWDPVDVRPAAGAGARGDASSAAGGSAGGGGFPFGWIAAASSVVIALGLLFERRRARSRRKAYSDPARAADRIPG